MRTIVTVTFNPSVDASTSAERVVPDRKLRCEEMRYDPGGGGINVARAVRNFGGEARAVWTCGGLAGERLRRLLEAEGVPHEHVPIAGETRQSFTCFDRSSQQPYRFNAPGPRLSAEEVDEVFERVRRARPDYVVGSGSLPPGVPDDAYARLADLSAEIGARFVLDTSGPPLLAAVEHGGIYMAKPNYAEVCSIVEGTGCDETDVDRAAHGIVESGRVEIVVVSLGRAGALLVSREESLRVDAPTVPIRSGIGAGDTMVGGMMVRLAEDSPLEDVVRYGVAAGASAVMNAGTQLGRREDADRLFARMRLDVGAGADSG